jgi:hypothetical protein
MNPYLTSAERAVCVDDVVGAVVLMQHHGAPTRLLDWSYSIWVAAYHCACVPLDCDGFIWMYDQKAFYDLWPRPWKERADRLLLAKSLEQYMAVMCPVEEFFAPMGLIESTSRMVAQQSVFTIANPAHSDHAALIGSVLESDRAFVLRVPAALKRPLMQRLLQMNVCASSLYPGLDGVGRLVTEAKTHGLRIPKF